MVAKQMAQVAGARQNLGLREGTELRSDLKHASATKFSRKRCARPPHTCPSPPAPR